MIEQFQPVQPDRREAVGLDVCPDEEPLAVVLPWAGVKPGRTRLRDQLPEPLRSELDRLFCEAAHPANRRRRPMRSAPPERGAE